MSFKLKALGAFKKLGAVALIIATIFFTACNHTGGGNQGAPFVEGGASLILSPDKLNIKVKAKTADGSAVTVEGCNETTLKSDVETELHAKGTTVILKGKITELHCSDNKLTELNVQGLTSLQNLECYFNQLSELNVQGLTALHSLGCFGNQLTALNIQGLTSLQMLSCNTNQLTELNVQGLTALKWLKCHSNKLNAQAMTELLQALPAREASYKGGATLYTEETDIPEGNCKDYTQPAELKAAFDDAKNRNWQLQKKKANSIWEDI